MNVYFPWNHQETIAMMISREIEVSQFVQIPLMIETLFGDESLRDTGKEG